MKARTWIVMAVLAAGQGYGLCSDIGIEVTRERASLLSPAGPGAAFWFAPQSWSDHDLRSVNLGVLTFDAAGPLAAALLDEAEAASADVMAPRGPRVQKRLAAAPVARRAGSVGSGGRRIMGIFRPVLRVRLTPRLGDVGALRPEKTGHGGGGPLRGRE